MKNILPRLLIALAALYSVQPAGPLAAVFYCMSATPEQATVFMIWAALLLALSMVFLCAAAAWAYKPVASTLRRIDDGLSCSDDELIRAAKLNSSLPVKITLLYCLVLFTTELLNYLVYLSYDIGPISAVGIWGGGIAGTIACPFMALGVISLILQSNTEFFAVQLGSRKLESQNTRIAIFPKLVLCFIAFAMGFAVWLGFAGFYTGINQTIAEIKQGDGELLASLVYSAEDTGQTAQSDQALKSLGTRYPNRHFFLTDSKGHLVASTHGDTLQIKRWKSLINPLSDGLTSKTPGTLYDNVNDRVISWMPMGKDRMLGTVTYINTRLPRFLAFFIWSGIFIAIGFGVGMGLGVSNVLATCQSINLAANVLHDLAEGEGDLSTRLPVTSDDEVGDLTRHFNTFIDKLYRMIQNIVDKSKEIRASSQHFSDLSNNMNRDIHDLQLDTAQVSNMSGETNRELVEVSSSYDMTNEKVVQVSAASEEMASSIAEVAKKSEEARQTAESAVMTAQNASERIIKLGSAAKDIDKVTEVITEISEQINLLALNATIESARAGDAGKGFAVVANEIKDLARQTAQATQEIKERITGIQTATNETVGEMQSISTVISSVNEFVFSIAGAVEEQSATTGEIASNMARVSEGVNDVNDRVAKSTESTSSMSEHMGKINIKADSLTENSAKVDESAQQLLTISEQLNEQLSKFKL